jgi:hypothetical protein
VTHLCQTDCKMSDRLLFMCFAFSEFPDKYFLASFQHSSPLLMSLVSWARRSLICLFLTAIFFSSSANWVNQTFTDSLSDASFSLLMESYCCRVWHFLSNSVPLSIDLEQANLTAFVNICLFVLVYYNFNSDTNSTFWSMQSIKLTIILWIYLSCVAAEICISFLQFFTY